MRTNRKRRVLAAAAGLACPVVAVTFNELVVQSGPPAAAAAILMALLATAVAAAVAVEWPSSRRQLPAAAVIVAGPCIALSLVHHSADTPREAVWLVLEMVAVLVILTLSIRSATRPTLPAVAVLAAAQVLTVLRVVEPAAPYDLAGPFFVWGLAALGAAGLGLYLRFLDSQSNRSVELARRAQRLELARDLHDFVAHDVTGMVVQAQAGQVVARSDPDAALAALRQVEQAGLHALGSLDRTVRMLGELTEPRTTPAPAEHLGAAAELVNRFGATGGTRTRFTLDPRLAPELPSEQAGLVHRIVLEALTNVRRHAPGARRVDVRMARVETAVGPAASVEVFNATAAEGAVAAAEVGSGNGSGLAALRERVERAGGTFAAGSAAAPAGWRVRATIPYAAGGS